MIQNLLIFLITFLIYQVSCDILNKVPGFKIVSKDLKLLLMNIRT